MPGTWTIGTVLRAAQDYLGRKMTDSPRREAELLLAQTLDVSRFDLYTQYDRPLGEEERASFRRLIKKRSSGVPLQHITGSQPFRHLDLSVEPGVFIPRPETELLVEAVIDELKATGPGPAVLDIGTGSGAVCLSLAYEMPGADVWTVDVGPQATALARRNAAKHQLHERVKFLTGDLFAPIPPGQQFEAIVSNPPYIPTSQIDGLMAEVSCHEPRLALDGGADGLTFYDRIIKEAAPRLKPGGLVAFEIGIGQADSVSAMLESGAFSGITVRNDYSGLERIIPARL